MQDLTALCLREPLTLLLTTQTRVMLPPSIGNTVLTIAEVGSADRRAVLTSYGAPQIEEMSEPFRTAYELSIAAECAAELAPPLTRGQLFQAFVRRRLGNTVSPALTRTVLRQVALAMDEQLVTTLPVDDVWRVGERTLLRHTGSAGVMDDVFRCKLVRVQQGVFAFSHELIGRFLASEALLLDTTTPQQLIEQLRKPRHADLIELTLPLETRPELLQELLAGLADSSLLIRALDDRLGAVAARVMNREARTLLSETTGFMKEVSVVFRTATEPLPEISYDREGPDSNAGALLAAVGQVLPTGAFLDEAVMLLDATDQALHRASEAGASDGTKPVSPSVLGSAVSGMITSPGTRLPAAIMLQACEHARYDSRFGRRAYQPISIEKLATLIEEADGQSYSRLYLLCLLVDSAEPETVVHLVPGLLLKCRQTRAYHIRLTALDMTRMFSQVAAGETRSAIVTALESFKPSHIFLSSMVVEVMHSYGLIESPYDADGIVNQIRSVLAAPESEEAQQAAYAIVTNQFEDVVAQPYVEAFESLSDQDRLALLVMAALGANGGFFTDWILKRLLVARDRRTLPALKHWLRYPDSQTPTPQDDTACYALAMQAWALLEEAPPIQPPPKNQDEAAWQCYGQIIYWLGRPGLTPAKVRTRCAPLWDRLSGELALAAVDPAYHLAHAHGLTYEEGINSHRAIATTFPGELRRLLEGCLPHYAQLTSIYRYKQNKELAIYALDMLGHVGTESTRAILISYVDDVDLGTTAVSSLRHLRKGGKRPQ
jgi:hypothetical protein